MSTSHGKVAKGGRALSRLAWLPIPLLLGAICCCWSMGARGSYAPPFLLTALYLVATTISLATVVLIGRSVVAEGSPGLLVLCCGVVTWAVAGSVASIIWPRDINAAVTVHNSCIWVAAACHLVGAAISLRSKRTLHRPGWWLAAGVCVSLVFVSSVTIAAMTGRLPLFFVQGVGGTPVRQFALGSAITLFVLTATMLRPAKGSRISPFNYWYGMAVLLLAGQMFAMMLQVRVGSALFWLARASEFLGGAYMLIALVLGRAQSGRISLEKALKQTQYRYEVAIGIVIAAASARLIFLAGLGDGMAFITFYPAVMLAALYGGMRAGFAAIVLSAVLADYLWIGPMGSMGVENPADWLGIAVFIIGCGMICWIIGSMQAAQADMRRAEAEASAASERARSAEAIARHVAITEGINRVLGAALKSQTEQQLGGVCLEVAEKITWSGCGFIGEVNDNGLADIAVSNPGWDACSILGPDGHSRPPANLALRGIFGRVLTDGKSVMTNDPPRHPDSVGVPAGHPPITSFLGVPLFHEGKLMGMIGVANRAGGYTQAQQDALEALAPAIVEAFMRKRAEEALRRSDEHFQALAAATFEGIVISEEGKYVDVNEQFLQLLGYTREELIGKELAFTIPPEDREHVLRNQREGRETMTEHTLLRKDGTRIAVEAHGRTLAYQNRRVRFTAIRDVTRQRQEAEVLHRYELLASQSRDIILFVDREDGRILDANAAAVDAYGWSREQLRSMTVHALRSPEMRAMTEEQLAEADRRGVLFETVHQRQDGSVFPVEVSSRGATIGGRRTLVSVVRDISSRKTADDALRASEQRYRELFQAMQESLFVVEIITDSAGTPTDWRYVEVNPQVERQMGLSREQMVAKTYRQIVSKPDPAWITLIGKVGLTGAATTQELYAPTIGRWVNVNAYSPRPRQVAVLFTDITERRQAEEALKRMNRTLRALSKSGQAIMRATNEHRYITEVCEIIVQDCGHLLAWVGYARPDEAKTVEVAAHAGVDRGYLQKAQITWADTERGRGPTGTAIRSGLPVICNDMHTDQRLHPWREEALKRGFAASIALPLIAEGQALGALTIYSDQPAPFSEREVSLLGELADDLAHGITSIRLREAHAQRTRQLEATKADAENASKAKDHFLAVLSHELRNPLNPVLACASMLREDSRLDAQTHELLEIICRNAELEARLIDDLLDVTRIEKGKLELDKRRVALGTIIHRAAEVCMPDIRAKKLEFRIDAPEDSHIVDADQARLQQVFWNLLKNAVKFTAAGGQVSVTCRSDGAGTVVTEIVDTGEGIEPDVLGRIFDAFEQGGRQTTRQFGGLGLGLAISKALVDMHGGTLSAHSDGKGKGARFAVVLPLLPAQAMAAAALATSDVPSAADAPRPARILLVEDHEDTARIMSRLLTSQGHEVHLAGEIGTALRLASTKDLDLMLSDLGLPDGSGLDLMRKVRAMGLDIPGIALSGYGQEQDLQQTREAGFAVHLVKPVSLAKLRDAIAKATRKSERGACEAKA